MTIVLFQPEIPQNTGNIIRTCYLTNTELILVRPYSFSLSTKALKRCALDYFNEVKIVEIDDLLTFLEKSNSSFYFFSSKATKKYSEISYKKEDLLIFGSETAGLPSIFRKKWENKFATIPMKKNSRCLNLSNSVSIVLYEALRQQNFPF